MKMHTTFTKILDFIAMNVRNKKIKIREGKIDDLVKKVDFYPFLQPIFNTDGNKIVGCEVLLRVKTSTGFTSPVSYIKYLENSRHMNKITEQLLSDVSDFFLEHIHHLPDGFYFSFNIFAPQLNSKSLVKEMISFCDKFKGKASLVLEIVERGTLKLNEDTMEIMDVLMNKGIRFAIDDFGAGTSSLKYIEHVGFSTIKIDRELTLSTGNTLIYQKVIDAIVALSAELGLSVTAEGVENPVQLELLHKAGVNCMQGYYLAKPMDMPKFKNMYLNYE
ncbi:TPA: EAL domain-containing protein [Enterobacter hormaechei subsp. xiangfangensis]